MKFVKHPLAEYWLCAIHTVYLSLISISSKFTLFFYNVMYPSQPLTLSSVYIHTKTMPSNTFKHTEHTQLHDIHTRNAHSQMYVVKK